MIPNEEREAALNRKLLEAIFAGIENGIQVLQAICANNEIVDLRRMLPQGEDLPVGRENKDSMLLARYPQLKSSGVLNDLKRVLKAGASLDEVFHYGDEGADTWIRLKAQKFGDKVLVTKEDLTRSREAEERLMQLNRALFAKNRELETLSSELKTFNTIAANDYNDTLRNLYTSMEFLVNNDAKNLSDPGRANVRRAQAAIQKLKLLTEDIVAFSKISTDEPLSPIDLNEVMAIVRNSLKRKIEENRASLEYSALPVIQGYPLLVSILFTHLLDNAIKFRKPDVDPVVTMTHQVEDGINIKHTMANKDLRYDRISVIDNGIGFDPSEEEKIFTMFYLLHERGKTKGSGIGLAICKKIMDLHGGFISAECTPECTTFRCFFPREKMD